MRKIVITILVGCLFIPESRTQISLSPWVEGLSQPVDIANAGDGTHRLFVVERHGRIRVVDPVGNLLPQPFLDISSQVDHSGGEEGLLGLVFHPKYAENGFFFVYYTQTEGSDRRAVIERYSVSNDLNLADPLSAIIIMTIAQPQENHNGGDMSFGPQGHLFIGVGDGGSANDPGERSQNLTLPLGKLLRINVDQLPYSIPADNPFANATGDTLKAIWAWGLRNPWRFSFDSQFNLWIGDVGQSAREEINYLPVESHQPGLNYGWDCREGDIPCSGCGNNRCSGLTFTEPIYWYGPGPGLSITGGYVLEGDHYQAFKGHYIFADYALDEIRTLKINHSQSVSISEAIRANNISTFGKDEQNRVYAADYAGIVYQIVETGQVPTDLLTVKLERHEKGIMLDWNTGIGLEALHFEVERSHANGTFKQIGIVPVGKMVADYTDYQFYDMLEFPGQYLYRLKSVDQDGVFTYSLTMTIEIEVQQSLSLLPNPAKDKVIVYLANIKESGVLQLISLNGDILRQIHVEDSKTGYIQLDLNELTRGLYMVQFRSEKGNKITKKLVVY